MSILQNPKNEICYICKLLFQQKLVSGTDGNISIRANENEMYITPSGVSKRALIEDDILRQGFNGVVKEGNRPSSKEAGLHILLYKHRPQVGAIIHTHPAAATAFAACAMPLPQNVLIEAPLFLGETAIVPYAKPGSKELIDALDATIKASDKPHDIFFLQNHGVIVCGENLSQAFDKMDALENTARSIIYANMLGGAVPIP